MSAAQQSATPSNLASTRVNRRAARAWLLAWAILGGCALSFALFVRVTLYSRSGLLEMGVKGLLPSGLALAVLVVWFLAAAWVLGTIGPSRNTAGARSSRLVLIAASYLPLLATLPITIGVIGSEAFAQGYWIDRSVKVELLLGAPASVLLMQAVVWARYRFASSWSATAPLLTVLGVAFVLRCAGMGWGLPYAYQPEETSIYFRWANEVALHGEWNPHYFQNPSLLIYMIGVEFIAVYSICRALLFASDPGSLYMVFRGEQDLFFNVGRMNSVVLGTATVLVVYLIARRWWGGRAALIAAALLAVSFLHVRNSQYGVNDVPSTFFLVLSLYFAVLIAERGRWRDYLLAGLAAGLAAATKYNAGMVVISIAVAHCVGYRNLRTVLSPRSLSRLVVAAVAAMGGFVIGTPYSVLDFAGFRQGFLEQLGMGQQAWSGQESAVTVWLYATGIVQGAGLAAVLLAVAGTAMLLARERGRAFLLLSFPVLYLGFMSAMALFFVRWAVPVMPFVALLAAYGLDRVVGLVSARRRQLVWVALSALILIQPAIYSVRLDTLLHGTDTREEANRWAEANIPAGSKVAIEAFSILDQESLSFRPTLQQIDLELDWRATMHDLDYYRSEGFDYIAISSWMYDRAFEQPEAYADRIEFYQRLDREYPLVASFYPRAGGASAPYALDDLDTPFWHLFSYDRPGPTVKVYRLSR